jgi:hypothetical protein
MQLGEHEEDGVKQRLVRNNQRKEQEDEDEFLAGHRKRANAYPAGSSEEGKRRL